LFGCFSAVIWDPRLLGTGVTQTMRTYS